MAILALSTAAETMVALQVRGQVFFRVNTERRKQAEFLVPLVNELLEEAGVEYKNLSRVAVITGPGSFTGLRVGIATAQGIALGVSVPCVGIDAFMLWRAAARRSGITAPLAIALDTLRDDVFITAYDKMSRYERCLLDAQVVTTPTAERLLNDNPYLSLTGDAYAQLPAHPFVPISHTVLAEALLDIAERIDPATAPAQPLYLRAPDVTQPVNQNNA
jgi:tRNA threonylcarbamoyladenosine biosynthesis protein TsaB